jgi:hypothetical protein
MKVIVDVQKLWNKFHEVGSESFSEYMEDCLGDLMMYQSYPEWAEKKTATKLAKMDGEYTQLFEDVWSAYPKKVGKGLAFAAWKVICKKNDELFIRNNILAALLWQMPLWNKHNNKYVPNPENYLKGRRWEDEQPPQKAKQEKYMDINGVWRERG